MIEFTSELSDPVIMQSKRTMSHILHKKNLATGHSVAKTLIKYNNRNRLEENDEEEKERINIEFTEQTRSL